MKKHEAGIKISAGHLGSPLSDRPGAPKIDLRSRIIYKKSYRFESEGGVSTESD